MGAPTPLAPGNLDAALELLSQAGLPTEGVADHVAGFLAVHDPDGTLLAVGGLETFAEPARAALIRSVVVAPHARGRGLGDRLVRALLESADARGIGEVWLLTETAADWFPRFGFVAAARSEIQDELHRSAELNGACDASAPVMVRRNRR